VWRASASYVTGAHNIKVGYQAAFQVQKQFDYAVNSGIQDYFFFGGFPIQLTQRISPHQFSNRTRFDASCRTSGRDVDAPGAALRARLELAG
jgi:hypothetical protein